MFILLCQGYIIEVRTNKIQHLVLQGAKYSSHVINNNNEKMRDKTDVIYKYIVLLLDSVLNKG